jgi:hypothetical protein
MTKRRIRLLLGCVGVLFFTILLLAISPAIKASRTMALVRTVTPGVTRLEEFRSSLVARHAILCDGKECKFTSVIVNPVASFLGIAAPTSLSVEVWFEGGVASYTQILLMVGEEGQHAFFVLTDSTKLLKCRAPCASRTKTGIAVALDPRVSSGDRANLLRLNSNCLWLGSSCRSIEDAYPATNMLVPQKLFNSN